MDVVHNRLLQCIHDIKMGPNRQTITIFLGKNHAQVPSCVVVKSRVLKEHFRTDQAHAELLAYGDF